MDGCRARLDDGLHQLEGVQRAAETGFCVGYNGSKPIDTVATLGIMDLVGTLESVINRADQHRDAIRRVQALVGIHLPRAIGVRSHLPPAHVDGLQSRLHLLDCLVAGKSAKSGHVALRVQEVPQSLRPQPCQRVLDDDGASQPHHVSGSVGTFDPPPARICVPSIGNRKSLISVVFRIARHCVLLHGPLNGQTYCASTSKARSRKMDQMDPSESDYSSGAGPAHGTWPLR